MSYLIVRTCPVLTKIGQQALDCDLAIVHDDDLTQIDGICDGTVSGHFIIQNYAIFAY